VSLESLQKLKKFYVPKNKNDIHKTGLGSSAAMVTSLTAAVLQHFNVVKIPYEDEAVELDHLDDPYKEIIHRTAQFCHCLAQGKIGSGFDVASATFGSQKYTRFDPSILESLLQYGITKMEQKQGEHVYALACEQTHIQELLDTLELEKLSTSGTSIWDTKHETFQLPPLFHLFVADVDQGSNTPNMVRSVLQWRKENPQLALEMWTEIDTLNTKVENAFNELTSMSHRDPKGYKETLTTLGQVKFSEWNSASVARGQVRNYMIEIRTMFVQIRQLLKKMGQLAFNEPIEPDQQTNLLDATMNVPGCLIAGVPGAGGFDAIFSILFGEEQEVKTRVASLWTNYTDASVCPLVLNESLSKGVVQSREKAVWG
jgi:phosphomevalonate kinase